MTKKVAILISGILRSFTDTLLPFIIQLPDNFDVYISISKENDIDDRFFNDSMDLNNLLKYNKIKYIHCDSTDIIIDNIYTIREKNIIIQWNRLYKLFNSITADYDIYIRMRPDINITTTVNDFIDLINNAKNNILYIPNGYDIFDTSFLNKEEKSINDQFAYGSYNVMNKYCNLYNNVEFKSQLISEKILYEYLIENNIKIERVNIEYNLVLSKCFTIAICGDSGAGKTTLSNIIQDILPFDNSLLFETDRYHKWERGSENYKKYTHLHPAANHLEKFSEDAYKLKMGDDVYAIDYDHSTGKFTDSKCIKSKEFILFCGLHTLYKKSLREICDLKIYIDNDISLTHEWKINRDTVKRGVSREAVIKNIEYRQNDYINYILPQKEYANIIISYTPNSKFDELTLEITISNIFKEIVHDSIKKIADNIDETDNFTKYIFNKNRTSAELTQLAKNINYNLKDLKDSFEGIIQYIILLIIWKK